MEFKFKEVNHSDLLEIAYLYRQAYNDSGWNEQWDIGISYTRIQEFFSSRFVFGIACLFDTKIVGVLIYELSSWDFGKQCEIKEVFVSPSYRLKGIGRRLFKELEKKCNESNVFSFSLWTADSEELVSFYTKMGFTINNQVIQMTK